MSFQQNRFHNKYSKQTNNHINNSSIKHRSIGSIYLCNLLKLRVPVPDHGSLISSEADTHKAQRTMPVKNLIGSTNIEGELKLRYVDDLCTINAQQWIKEIEHAREAAKWDCQTTAEVTKALLGPKYDELIGANKTFSAIKNKILAKQYPDTMKPQHISELKQIKQKNYGRIKQYFNNLKGTIEKLKICNKWKNGEEKERLEDAFFENLHPSAQTRITELGLTSSSEIVEMIERIENQTITQNITSKAHTGPNKSNYTEKLHKNIESKPKKWCDYHKSPTHNNQDCNAQNKEKRDNQSNRRINLLARELDTSMILDSSINGHLIKSLLDTGAQANYISESVAIQCGLKTNPCVEHVVSTASNEQLSTENCVNARVIIQSVHNKEFLLNAYVIKSLAHGIILGQNFMEENACKIDFKSRIIEIDGTPVEMNEGKNRNEQIKIQNKVSLAYLSSDITQDLLNENNRISIEKNPIKNTEIRIELTEDTPVQNKPYVVPISQRDKLEKHIEELVQKGIIRPSKSPYSSHAFTKVKPSGDLRLIVNYSNLNSITKSEYFPFPTVHDQFLSLAGSKCFSKIDLKMGYHQIRISKDDQYKTAFSILGRKFEYLRMPFGMRNAPFLFQQAMKSILGNERNVCIFLDDILIYSKDKHEHTKDLIRILKILNTNNVLINKDKSEFFAEEVTFL